VAFGLERFILDLLIGPLLYLPGPSPQFSDEVIRQWSPRERYAHHYKFLDNLLSLFENGIMRFKNNRTIFGRRCEKTSWNFLI